MPRLLHIMDFAPRGTRSFDYFILALAEGLRQREWEVRFAFNAEPPEAFRQEILETGADYVVIPFPFTRGSARELRRKLGNFRPDVTQASFLSAFTPALLGWKIWGYTRRLIVIDHASGEGPNHHGVKRWLARLRGAIAGRIVDAVLPVSHAIARRDVERVFLPAHKVRAVYNGIRLDRFPNPSRPPRDTACVVFAGQLIPQKGVLTLLRAHNRLRKMGVTNYELLIAGKGSQEEELKAFCKESGQEDVRFLGHIDSVPEVFATADVVVIPSEWFEAFGLVAAEAMACGAACLVSDSGALPEVVGEAGRVFKTGDEGALAANLHWLIQNPELRSHLGRAGRARVESLFALDRIVEEHVAICEM